MSKKDTEDTVIYIERLLEAKLDPEVFHVFMNKSQINVDVIGTNYRFYTQVTGNSTRGVIFFYSLNGKIQEGTLSDIVHKVERKFHNWNRIDEGRCHSNQVVLCGVMLENIPIMIKKITESALANADLIKEMLNEEQAA